MRPVEDILNNSFLKDDRIKMARELKCFLETSQPIDPYGFISQFRNKLRLEGYPRAQILSLVNSSIQFYILCEYLSLYEEE